MKALKTLTEEIGGWWTGVQFHFDDAPQTDPKSETLHFCEAVAASRTGPVILTPERTDCPGARRSFNWAEGDDAGLAAAMAEKTGIAAEAAQNLVFETPRLKSRPQAITVGECPQPDVALSFIQAEAAMKLLRRLEERSGSALSVKMPTVMAACGNVAVKAYLTRRPCFSFGCPDSREHGAIGRDQLIVGLPVDLAVELA